MPSLGFYLKFKLAYVTYTDIFNAIIVVIKDVDKSAAFCGSSAPKPQRKSAVWIRAQFMAGAAKI